MVAEIMVADQMEAMEEIVSMEPSRRAVLIATVVVDSATRSGLMEGTLASKIEDKLTGFELLPEITIVHHNFQLGTLITF